MNKMHKCKTGYILRLDRVKDCKISGISLLIFVILFFSVYSSFQLEGQTTLNVMDYYIKIFWGTKEFRHMDRLTIFLLPKEWLFVQFPIVFLTAYFLEGDLTIKGIQALIRMEGRRVWWNVKKNWAVRITLQYYIIFYLVFDICSMVSGARWDVPIQTDIGQLTMQNLIIMTRIMPCVVSMAMASINLLLVINFSVIIAFVFDIIYYVGSVFYMSPFLIGNYSMLCRNVDATNMKDLLGIILCMWIAVLSNMIGYRLFKKVDIYGRK